jgi:methionyl-tRNA synthetase
MAVAQEVVQEYREAMDALAFQRALRALWRLLAEANQYIVAREPWKTIKSEGADTSLSRVLWNGLECVRIVATALLPFLPSLAPRILKGIGAGEPPASLDGLAWGGMPNGAPLPALEPIFPRIDKEKYMNEISATRAGDTPPAEASQSSGSKEEGLIDIRQFATVELLVGRVAECEVVPKSEKLLRLSVDLGEADRRQVIAGIAKAYRPEDLVDTEVVVVANLKPAKLMGQVSQGMVLAATDADGQPILLRPDRPGSVPGTPVK